MAYVIIETCIGTKDSACVDVCPVDCIHPRKDEPEFEKVEQLYIHPDECIDCGACEPVCPVEAIFYENDVPGDWTDYHKANVEFFDDLGSPGGASGLGPVERDHPLVAGQPVRTA
jgi:ferredoxin